MRRILVGLLVCLGVLAYFVFLYQTRWKGGGNESQGEADTTIVDDLPRSLIDIPLEGQWYETSCWAATLSMASKYLAPDSIHLNQCYFVTKLVKNSIPDKTVCGCVPFVNGKNLDTLKTITTSETEPCMYLNTLYPDVAATTGNIEKFSSYITKETISTSMQPLPISILKSKFSDSKPVIHSYGMGYAVESEQKHVVLLANLQTPLFKKSEKMSDMHLLNVKNPWPQGNGSEYFMTYEQYHLQYLGTSIYYGKQVKETIQPDHETSQYMQTRISGNPASNDPKSIAKQFVTHLKNLNTTKTNRILLKKIGFQDSEFPDLATTTLDDQVSIPVVKLTVTAKSDVYIHNDTLQVEDIINERDFNQLIYFVRHNKKPVTAAWVSQKIKFEQGEIKEKKQFGNKWYLSQIESAQRFNLDSNVQYFSSKLSTTTIQPKIVLIQMDGEINAEILATPIIAYRRYRIIKTIRKGRKPFATTHKVR